jgi:hypothetical protein
MVCIISASGIQSTEQKVEAVKNAPQSTAREFYAAEIIPYNGELPWQVHQESKHNPSSS